MRYLVDSREMREYDRNTTEVYKIPSIVLMERAALAFVEKITELKIDARRVLVVCGSGNNGGDGYAIARLLWQRGSRVTVAAFRGKQSAENELQKKIWMSYGNPVFDAVPESEEFTLLIDAVFGVGLTREVAGEYRACIEAMNAMAGCRVAVDISSGVCADSGAILGCAFRADYTVTFAFAKRGSILWPGNEYAGRVIVVEIGIDERSFCGQYPAVRALESADLARLPARKSHSNKGDYGKLLSAAGSPGMAGAAYLSAKAAYAAGAGLVRVATPEENRTALAGMLPEAILASYPADGPCAKELRGAIQWADVILAGPGLSTSPVARIILQEILQNATGTVVLDADALNIIAEDTEQLLRTRAELILTPHMGEMARLTGLPVAAIQGRLIETAVEFAAKYRVVCVLKDEHTVTALPDGAVFLNLSGNAGMATAGSGDVLAGVIASLAAQGMAAGSAASFGVFLHGCAGDAAAEKVGMRGLMASDLIEGMRSVLAGRCL